MASVSSASSGKPAKLPDTVTLEGSTELSDLVVTPRSTQCLHGTERLSVNHIVDEKRIEKLTSQIRKSRGSGGGVSGESSFFSTGLSAFANLDGQTQLAIAELQVRLGECESNI